VKYLLLRRLENLRDSLTLPLVPMAKLACPLSLCALLIACQTTPPSDVKTLGDVYGNNSEEIAQETSDQQLLPAIDEDTQPQADLDPKEQKANQLAEKIKLYREVLQVTSSKTVAPTLEVKLLMMELEAANEDYNNKPEENDHFKQLLPKLKQWVTANPNHGQYHQMYYQYARALDLSEQPEAAEKALKTLLESVTAEAKSDTSDPKALALQQEIQFRVAEHAFSRRQYKQAAKHYSATIALNKQQTGEQKEKSDQLVIKSYYMRGWSNLQLNKFKPAAQDFTFLLQTKSLGQARIEEDSYRGLILSVHDAGGIESINQVIDPAEVRPFAIKLYKQFIAFFEQEKRFSEVINTHKVFQDNYPKHKAAPEFQLALLKYLKKKKQFETLRAEKANYILTYGPNTDYAFDFALELAESNQAQARKLKGKPQAAKYKESLKWYDYLVTTFKNHPKRFEIAFAGAEARYESGDVKNAEKAFQALAKMDIPAGQNQAINAKIQRKAAYLDILGLDRRVKAGDKNADQEKYQRAEVFVNKYPEHKSTPTLLIWLSQYAFDNNKPQATLKFTSKYLKNYPQSKNTLEVSALAADAYFMSNQWQNSIRSYNKLLKTAPKNTKAKLWREQKTKAVYQLARNTQNPQQKLSLLKNVYQSGSNSLAQSALYEAAMIASKINPSQAKSLILQLHTKYPNHSERIATQAQLIDLYKADKQWGDAGGALAELAKLSKDPSVKAASHLEASKYLRRAKDYKGAKTQVMAYLATKPQDYEAQFNAQRRLVALHKKLNEQTQAQRLIAQMVKADLASKQATQKTRSQSLTYAVSIAKQATSRYEAVAITRDLQNSFKRKKAALEQAAAELNQLKQFNMPLADQIASQGIGDLYTHLSKALLQSPIPAGLNELETEEYKIILEEQAFPFEEEAVGAFEQNVKRLQSNPKLWSQPIENSYKELSKLLPIRYRKPELTDKGLVHVD